MRVLLATDGSPDALRAAEFLRTFPLPAGSSIWVLGVVANPRFGVGNDEFRAAVRASVREIAERSSKVLAPTGAAIDTLVLDGDATGDPRPVIIDAADRADLVVLGARGLGAVARFLLGSVSTAVARHAPSSVLVVKDDARKVGSIVIGVDGSPNSLDAVGFVSGLGDLHGVSVHLLGVAEATPVPPTAPGLLAARLQAMVDDLHRERRQELDVVLTRAGAPLSGRVAALEHSTAVGNAADEIVGLATARRADLVVVGARGLGAVKRLLLGSVSERVLTHAPCPVLIVKSH